MPRIVSFDIGLKTCSVAVEDYTLSSTALTPPVANKRYLATLEATSEMKDFVKGVGCCGRVVWLEKRELGNKKDFFANVAFQRLYSWVKELHPHLETADVVLIEQQMRINNIAMALMHHLHACLLMTYTNKRVMLYASKNKTRVLGAPLKALDEGKKKMIKVTKYDRKKWSTDQADRLLKDRKDDRWHTYIFKDNKSKKDDLSDVLMQTLSYVVAEKMAGKWMDTHLETTSVQPKRASYQEEVCVDQSTFTATKRVKRV
jgi:hypothetical protein